MGHRLRAGEPTYEEALAEAFAFLHAEDFTGPATTKLGHTYTSPDMVVEIWLLTHAWETTLSTLIERTAGDTTQTAWLEALYVAAGCGPAQHVPGSVTSGWA